MKPMTCPGCSSRCSRPLLAVLLLVFGLLAGGTLYMELANGGGRRSVDLLAVEDAAAAKQREFEASHVLLQKYCFDCHGPEKQKADLNFALFDSPLSIQKERQTWESVRRMVLTEEMPPKKSTQPTSDERQQLGDWIIATLNDIDCDGPRDPGRVVVRRLSRYEYRNTIRDLIGIDYEPTSEFPADDVGYGFDNIGDVLSLPPLLMEKYLAAAEEIVNLAVTEDPATYPVTLGIDPTTLEGGRRVRNSGEVKVFTSNSDISADITLPATGKYRIRLTAAGSPGNYIWPKMAVIVDQVMQTTVEVDATTEYPRVYEHELTAEAGRRTLTIAYTNDYYNENHEDEAQRDRNLYLHDIEIIGPLDVPSPNASESHLRIFDGSADAPDDLTAARFVIDRFATRAFRRPVTSEEVDRFIGLYEAGIAEGMNRYQAMKLPLMGVLVSPHFLFRVETDHEWIAADAQGVAPISDYELATRLSYFLWSSMPDQELFDTAASGQLHEPEVLAAQVRRMLRDERSMALAENFASQWLQIRRLAEVTPDTQKFPAWTPELRAAMRREAELLFAAVVREDRSILELINADFTYVNEPLAKHYGLEGITGPEMQRVDVAGTIRGGVLTMAGILTVNSNPTRTNPTRRGKWVMETILGTPPPPPVPDVGNLEDSAEADRKLSVRELLEKHRSDPNCAGCHSRMDPIGFAFERLDGIGGWRELDDGRPINDSGVLPDGKSFAGPTEFKAILTLEPEIFAKSLTEQLMTYALGRGMEYYDACAIRSVVQALSVQDYSFAALVTEIAQSYPFRHRRTRDYKPAD